MEVQVMAGHLSTRIFTAATGSLVRETAPKVARLVKNLVQLIGFMILAGLFLIGVWFAGDAGVPGGILKTIAVAVVLIWLAFSLIVVAEQIRITYAKAPDVVYPEVGVFEDREPM